MLKPALDFSRNDGLVFSFLTKYKELRSVLLIPAKMHSIYAIIPKEIICDANISNV